MVCSRQKNAKIRGEFTVMVIAVQKMQIHLLDVKLKHFRFQ